MIAFMVAVKHTQDDTLWSHLCSYSKDDTPIIMARETSKKSHQDISGQHFHIYIGWEDKTWEAFKKTILIKKLQLRGKANANLARQYGRVTKIKDQEKMIAYTIKCNDYKYKNFDKTYLDHIYKNESYEKEDKLDYQETLMKHLLATRDKFIMPEETTDSPIKVYDLAEEILLHNMENKDKPICKSKLNYYISYYLQCIEPLRFNKKMRDTILSIILRGI
jgi:hypothetical protein